jgi:ribosomal protein S24E
MEVKILEKKKNELAKRTEVTAEVLGEKLIPSRAQIREKLAAQLGVKSDAIAVEKIGSKFGSSNVKIKANVYASVEELKKTEPKHITKRNVAEEKKEGAAEENTDAPASFKK